MASSQPNYLRRSHKPPLGVALNASQIVLLSFLTFILVGWALLALPWSHQGAAHAPIDDLFTAASAVCVTGLATIDPGTGYSLFGEIVILALIQIGGLGYMTLFTVSMVLIGKRISMRDRLNIQEATDQPGMTGLIGYLMNVLRLTLVVEGIGTLLLALQTVPEFGVGRGLYLALFYSVAAFNNAGFSLAPTNTASWQHSGFILTVLGTMVIIGGLGYNVNMELVRRYLQKRKAQPKWNILLKLVLGMTAVLLVLGTLVIWLYERNNPATLGSLTWTEQWANAFFLSANARSAGFNTVDMTAMTRPSLLLTLLFMFIGAGPGSTAGGIKLTTLAVLIATVYAAIRGEAEVKLFNLKRRVSEKIAYKAVAVVAVSGLWIMVATFLITSFETMEFLPVLFETVSAFATVGLTMGITADLSAPSKLVLILTMYAGRVGVLFILLAMFTARKKSALHYAEEPLLIG